MTDYTLTLKGSNFKFSGNDLFVNQYENLRFVLSGLNWTLIEANKTLRLTYLSVRSVDQVLVVFADL